MSTSDPALPTGVSAFVPRGPVAHEIHGLRLSVIVNDLVVILLAMFGAYFMMRAFNRVDSAATTATKIQTLQQQLVTTTAVIQDLQQQQVSSSVTGRAILKIVADQTSPTATAHQQAAVAGYLKQLTDAQKTLNADQLRKEGELAMCVPCSPAAVQRILNEPVPVITFGPAPTPSATLSPPAVARASSTSPPTPRPSPTLTPAVQIQCPVICPQQH